MDSEDKQLIEVNQFNLDCMMYRQLRTLFGYYLSGRKDEYKNSKESFWNKNLPKPPKAIEREIKWKI
jgi:hypothetical protein